MKKQIQTQIQKTNEGEDIFHPDSCTGKRQGRTNSNKALRLSVFARKNQTQIKLWALASLREKLKLNESIAR